MGFLAVAFAGCASARPAELISTNLGGEIRARGIDPGTVVIPFEVTEEMRAWARDTVKSTNLPESRLSHLLNAILQRGDLEYQRGFTATAQEVWKTNRANCLSFTHLYVALAREVGLPVYYLRVYDLREFEKSGDLVIASDHVTAAWGPPSHRRVLDFSDRPVTEYHQTEPISDLTALALHYANVGAEQIRGGNLEDAERTLRTSVQLDPGLADGWVNLGVALRRLGHQAEAESSFRRAVEANPQLLPAQTNLAMLLEGEGRTEEARNFREATNRRSNRDPFSYLVLGDLAMSAGDLSEAARLFQLARKLKPRHAEPLAALGQWALAVGRREEAERWYARAANIDAHDARVGELARMLGTVPAARSERAQM